MDRNSPESNLSPDTNQRFGLDRQNRTLRMISGCNQALLRATDETELIRSICHLLVEKGGYRMAWVGLAELENGEKKVRPIAHGGPTDGFLYHTRITWDESEHGRGPTGKSIRTGKPVFIRDLTKDPDFAPWREDVTARGYCSCISLPLKDKDNVFGALTIYSLKVEDFDEGEIEILAEMAGDVAYGIRALRTTAEHAKLEKELLAREAQLNLILNNVTDIIFSVVVEPGPDGSGPDFRFEWVNDRFLAATGLKKEKVVGVRVAEVIPPQAHDLVFSKYREAIRTKQPVFWEEVSEYPSGKKYGHVTMVPVDDAKGVCRHLMGVVNDTTESRVAEEKLKENERKYRELVENANSIILRWTLDGRITFLNEYGQKFFGYSAGEIVGKHAMESIVPPSETGGRDLSHLMEQILADPAAFEQNVNENIKRNGERVWIAWTNKIVKGADGQVAEILSIGSDITARRKAEAEGEALRAQLFQAQKMESIGRLAGGVAHDFNNMLSVIISYADLVHGQLNPSDPLREDLGKILEAARRSAELTRQLLTFARKEVVVPQVIDLNQAVEGLTRFLQRLLGENIHLGWHHRGPTARVKVGPSHLDQILTNLCINARDAIQGTGHIDITTETMDLTEDYCRKHAGFQAGKFVRLTVSDTGSGMSEELLARVFEPFFTTKEAGKGTGLGLATVYGIVQQNKGFLNVKSKLGHGTTFDVYIPLHEGPVPQPSTAPQSLHLARSQARILLVEDEPAILQITSRVLKSLGYSVQGFLSPVEALQQARELDTLHLLISDVILPEMSGQELLRKVRSSFPKVKCLFMSGYTEEAIVLEEGMAFIQKPFNLEELSRKVREILG